MIITGTNKSISGGGDSGGNKSGSTRRKSVKATITTTELMLKYLGIYVYVHESLNTNF